MCIVWVVGPQVFRETTQPMVDAVSALDNRYATLFMFGALAADFLSAVFPA